MPKIALYCMLVCAFTGPVGCGLLNFLMPCNRHLSVHYQNKDNIHPTSAAGRSDVNKRNNKVRSSYC